MPDFEKVEKGLKCCAGMFSCSCCPYDENGSVFKECVGKLTKDALELINTAQARIESLTAQLDDKMLRS